MVCTLQSTPHMRGATRNRHEQPLICKVLQSTPHMRGATGPTQALSFYFKTLQSTPHMRGATGPTQALSFYFKTLQSTPHMRGATGHQYAALLSLGHFNPRPTCVGRLSSAATRGLLLYTSIHAPHAWGDFNGQFAAIIEEDTSIHAPHAWGDNNQQSNGIIKYTTSIHAPHAWGDALLTTLATALCTLQSTPHMRGATH